MLCLEPQNTKSTRAFRTPTTGRHGFWKYKRSIGSLVKSYATAITGSNHNIFSQYIIKMPGYKQEKYAPEKTEEVNTLEKRFSSDVGLSTTDYVYIAVLALAYFY